MESKEKTRKLPSNQSPKQAATQGAEGWQGERWPTQAEPAKLFDRVNRAGASQALEVGGYSSSIKTPSWLVRTQMTQIAQRS